MCKAKILSWWEQRLRGEAALLSSLPYFRPSHMSLNSPHPMWSLAETPFEVGKSCTVASLLSGCYVTDHRARHWSNINPSGYCQLCTMTRRPATPGTLEHMLLACPVLADTRKKAASHWKQRLSEYPCLLPIVKHHTLAPGQAGVELTMQLLLDPSTCPMVITAVQASGIGVLSHLLHMTRTWCHSHHLKRRKLLKLYNII